MDDLDRLKSVKAKLDQVGPGFCLLKWTQQTLYLQTGDNHSCYHPHPHKIDIKDIKRSPSGLHNTAHKAEQRKQMLKGRRPDECSFCWQVEDNGHISDRIINSANDMDVYDVVKNLDYDQDYNPKFIEVNFGNVCNFMCGYCTPTVSNSWIQDIKTNGPFPVITKQYNIDFIKDREYYESDDENNPYVKAFWDWWPTLIKDLKTLRITGGEPMLNQNTWQLLDKLEAEPAPHLTLLINSNLGVKPALIERLSERVRTLLNKKAIKDYRMHVSLDTWGAPAEYIRYGLDCTVWEQNFKTIMNNFKDINASVEIMVTYNNMVLPSFNLLLKKILEWRQLYGNRVEFITPHLKEPDHWSINILPAEFIKYIDADIDFMKQHLNKGFSAVEVERLERVRTHFKKHTLSLVREVHAKADFYRFFMEHDKRRGTDFLAVFPEYENFLKECKQYAK
jgi:organic radical activating enzyme